MLMLLTFVLKNLEVAVDNLISNTGVMTSKERCRLIAYKYTTIEVWDQIKEMNENIMKSINDQLEIYNDLVFLEVEVRTILLMIHQCLKQGVQPTNLTNQSTANISPPIIRQESQLVSNSILYTPQA